MFNFNHILRYSKLYPRIEPCTLGIISSPQLLKGITSKVPSRSLVLCQKVKNTYKIDRPDPCDDPPLTPDQNTKFKKFVIIGGSIFMIGVAYYVYENFRLPSSGSGNSKSKKNGKPIKIPSDPASIPKQVQYLLIGGGTSSFSAFRAIKTADPTAKVLVVTNELHYPYMRPPLSKEMWFQAESEVQKLRFKQWGGTERSLFFEPEEFFIKSDLLENEPKGGIAVIRGWTVTKLDPEQKVAVLDDGTEIKYNKCLLGTGIHPKNLPVFEKASESVKNKVTLFRNIDDFTDLHNIIQKGAKSIAIVGGSFLGSEIACALSKNNTSGLKITQVFPEKGNLGKILPSYLSSWTTESLRSQGIEIIPNVEVENVTSSGNGKQIEISVNNGKKILADHVVVAVGSESNTDLAESSRLEVDPELGGFLVNSELAARTDLYAAGDCACFYDPQLGRRRVEHHDHAVTSGRLAGENMTGAHKAYAHQSMFWSDLGPDIGFEAVGIVDSSLPTVAIYAKPTEESSEKKTEGEAEVKKKPSDDKIQTSLPKAGEDYSKGVVFYLQNDLIVGIVLWNVFNRLTVARQVLKERKKFDDLNEVAKLFGIHEDDYEF